MSARGLARRGNTRTTTAGRTATTARRARAEDAQDDASTPTPRALGFRFPAEWERHRGTWLAWPHQRADWPGKFEPIPWAFAELGRLLSEVEEVRLIVADAAAARDARRRLTAAGARMDRVSTLTLPTDRSWTRDFLPLHVVAGRGARARHGGVKFRFNGWARYPNHRRDEAAGQRVAAAFGEHAFHPVVGGRPVVLEGGAIDVDGQGTLLATRQCLLTGAHPRNAWLGVEGTERVLHDFLGIDHVIWLDEGIVGDDTTGHVDDFARFVAPGVVVVAEERRRTDANHAPLRAAQRALARARDARGQPLTVATLPMPRPVVFAGQRLPASYANFYFCNGRLLVPTFADPADAVALRTLEALCPDREVIGVPCRDLVLGLGTLHCSTQQIPF